MTVATAAARVAYLVNQYPKTSHSFVRREIRALETLGVVIDRYAIRSTDEPLVEPADRDEARVTRVLLAGGAAPLLVAVLLAMLTRPLRLARAAARTARLARWSDRGRVRPWAWLAEACLLVRWLSRSGARHLHAHFGTNAAAVALLARELGGPPFSFTAHGTESFDSPPSIALADKIAHATFVVAVSDWGRAQLMRWCGPGHWSKLHVVRCGVDAEFLAQPAAAVPDEPRIVCVARLSPEKGVEVLAEAFAQVARTDARAELVVVGDGEGRASFERHIAAAGVADRVRLCGWGDAAVVRREIQRARALVVPSFAEGLPVVIMEAFALRRPVVATAVGAVPELVETGVTGWLVPPGAPAALAAAMRAVLVASPQQLAAMGERGALRVAERHDTAREAAKIAALIGVQPARSAAPAETIAP